MLAHVITAYLHFLGIMTLMATLLAEHVMLHPQMPPVHLQRLARTDLFYGMAAGIVFLTGLLRFAYFGKGIHFYLGNPVFYIKVDVPAGCPYLGIPHDAVSCVAENAHTGRSS
jgi:putative membrane protein